MGLYDFQDCGGQSTIGNCRLSHRPLPVKIRWVSLVFWRFQPQIDIESLLLSIRSNEIPFNPTYSLTVLTAKQANN